MYTEVISVCQCFTSNGWWMSQGRGVAVLPFWSMQGAGLKKSLRHILFQGGTF